MESKGCNQDSCSLILSNINRNILECEYGIHLDICSIGYSFNRNIVEFRGCHNEEHERFGSNLNRNIVEFRVVICLLFI